MAAPRLPEFYFSQSRNSSTPSEESGNAEIKNVSDVETPPAPLSYSFSEDGSRQTNIRVIDGTNVIGLSDEEFGFYNTFTPEMRRKLNRRIDIRLLPFLGLLYLFSNLDRVNIGNAKIEGMAEDLKLTGLQYNTALSVFFISYIIVEIPSNIILKQIPRPSIYLGVLASIFGIITMCTGFVHTFGELSGIRFILGIFEAGSLPASIFIVSTWYAPADMATRVGGFFVFSPISGAFGGLLAAALTRLDGVGGYAGWRWIFIIEGAITVGVGALCAVFMIDLPSRSVKWLTPPEMRFLEVQRRIKQGGLQADGQDIEGGELGVGAWFELKMVATDWRMYALAFVTICQAAGLYGMKFVLPSLTKAMGFSNTNAQLLSAPPYIAGAIAAILIPTLSDRQKKRAAWCAFCFILMTISYAIILGFQGHFGGSNLGASYTFVVIPSIGVYGSAPIFISWASNNCAPAGRRAIVSAWLVMFGNLGGIAGSFMFLDREAPAYNTGFIVLVALSFSGLVVTFLVWRSFRAENRARDLVSEVDIRARYSDTELLKLGDRSPLFRHPL